MLSKITLFVECNKYKKKYLYPFLIIFVVITISSFRFFILQYYKIPLFVDETQYWVWSQKLDWGYFSKPPLVAWTISLISFFSSDTPAFVRFPSLLFYVFSILIVSIMSKKVYEIKAAFWTSLAIASMPLAGLCPFMTTDAPLFFFWSLSLLMFYSLYQNPDKRFGSWSILGIIWGLGTLSKYYFLLLPLSCFLFLCTGSLDKRKVALFFTALSVSLIVVSPNIIWNIQNNFPTFQHIAESNLDINNFAEWNFIRGSLFFFSQFLLIGPLIGLVLLRLLINPTVLRKLACSESTKYLLITLFCPLSIVTIQACKVSANANWVGPAWISGLMLAAGIIKEQIGNRLTKALFFSNFFLNFLLIIYIYNTQPMHNYLNVPTVDLFKRFHGWDVLIGKIVPELKKNPDYTLLVDDRTLFSYLMYELRNSIIKTKIQRAKSWADSIMPHNYFEQTRPFYELIECLRGKNGSADNSNLESNKEFLYSPKGTNYTIISQSPDIEKFKPYFPNIKLTKHIVAKSKKYAPLFDREVYIYSARNFLCSNY